MKIKTRDMILVALFAALMAVGALVKVIFPLVPFSLQPFFCAYAGILLGSRLGMLSQIVYLAVGLVGAPVFTKGGGPMYILEPSFGYLIGFVFAAYVIGKISEKLGTMNFKNVLISVIPGLFVINAIGLPYLYLIARIYLNNPNMTVAAALAAGFFPFIIKDIILYVIVAATACEIIPVMKKAGVLRA